MDEDNDTPTSAVIRGGENVVTQQLALVAVPLFAQDKNNVEATSAATAGFLPTEVQEYLQNHLLEWTTRPQPSSITDRMEHILVAVAVYAWFVPTAKHLVEQAVEYGKIYITEDKQDETEENVRRVQTVATRAWTALQSVLIQAALVSSDGDTDNQYFHTWLALVCQVVPPLLVLAVSASPSPWAKRQAELLQQITKSDSYINIQELRQSLGLKTSDTDTSSPTSTSLLRLLKHVQDQVAASPPRIWAILVEDGNQDGSQNDTIKTSLQLVQDCFPRAEVVLCDTQADHNRTHYQFSVVAAYNIPRPSSSSSSSSSSLGITTWGVDRLLMQSQSVEDRVRQQRRALLPPCTCDRCRYEMEPDTTWDSCNGLSHPSTWPPYTQILSVDRLLRLGHGYMALGNLASAKTVYERVLTRTNDKDNHPDRNDAYHALGALELSAGNFMAAQLKWLMARSNLIASKAIDNNNQHAGLALQFAKLDAYRYLDPNWVSTKDTATKLPKFEQVVPGAFVSPVLSSEMCDQIFAWATAKGSWTTQRHYAVPTCDIPVHEIPPLLSWFNDFMSETMRLLLARQFRTTPTYFVHDAFVVKYTAGKASNHLPIHTDESTHSFVIALNDDYQGGGTYFYDENKLVKLKKGEILSFRGDSMLHGGEAVQAGERHIVAVFLYLDKSSLTKKPREEAEVSRKRPLFLKPEGSGGSINQHKEAKSSFSFDFHITDAS